MIDLIRGNRPDPPLFTAARTVLLPLPAMGELLAGVCGSRHVEEALRGLEVTSEWPLLVPDLETAHQYGRIRARLGLGKAGPSNVNDLWIAALCIQHDVPLLTRDKSFDSIPNLTVLH